MSLYHHPPLRAPQARPCQMRPGDEDPDPDPALVAAEEAATGELAESGNGGPARTRTWDLRIMSPFQARSLTWANARKRPLTWCFACSAVRNTLHWISVNRVLSASWR
jgi:hypothetical protein